MSMTLLACLPILPAVLFANGETLESILQHHTEAIGGRSIIEATRTIRISLQIQEPEFTVNGVYVAERSGRMRIDIYSGDKRVYTEGFDGNKGWQMDGDGKVADSSEKGSRALQHGVTLPGKIFGLHEMKARGHTLEVLPRETVESVPYHVLKLTLKDGHALKYYIHPESWLIERTRDVRALHVDGVDATERSIENRLQDYRRVDGIQRAFLMEEHDVHSGKKLSTSTIKSIERNVPLDDSLFKKP